MKLRLYIVLIIVMLVSSCGEYEKLLKSTDYDLKKEKAIEYYNATQYVKATELFAQILPRYRATEEAEALNFMNAKSYYGMKDYIMAGSYFKSFIEQYPFGKNSEEANFLAAMCDYYLSPKPTLDQENSRKALEGFNLFISRFPSSPKVEESLGYIKELEEKLVEKSYISAKLYYDMRQYKAAVVALNNSLKEYADTKYREEMMFLKLNSLFLYAENSLAIRQKERYQATLDDYYSFMEEYPESKYDREVKRIYDETASYLKVGTTGIGVPETAVIN
jgi:outer membrane protein assembly factor BamD